MPAQDFGYTLLVPKYFSMHDFIQVLMSFLMTYSLRFILIDLHITTLSRHLWFGIPTCYLIILVVWCEVWRKLLIVNIYWLSPLLGFVCISATIDVT